MNQADVRKYKKLRMNIFNANGEKADVDAKADGNMEEIAHAGRIVTMHENCLNKFLAKHPTFLSEYKK